MRKTRSYFIAPVAVLLIIMSVYCSYGMFPFGDKTLAWCDMEQQVIPFLMDFKDILSGRSNLFFNLQNAGGMSFWGVFLFFISSPFTFLVAFVDKAKIYHLVNILVALKMMVCSLTASIFFAKRFRTLNVPQNVALSVMYAFCGYTMFYYQNHVWLDIMYLFPILLLGLIKLAEEEQIWLFILAFSAILTVNFYLSYMVVLFIILASAIYLLAVAPIGHRRKSVVLLGISTLLVSLITAVVWLPSLMQYVSSARAGDVLTSLKIGRFYTRFDTTLAVLMCSGAILAAAILFVLILRKHSKWGIAAFCIFLLTLVPVIIEPINKMWHTGNYQAFPVRYAYIPVFFGLILFAFILSSINKEHTLIFFDPFPFFIGLLAVSALLTVSVLFIKKDYNTITVYTRTLWGNEDSLKLLSSYFMVAALAYAIVLLLYRYKRLTKTAFSVLLCALVLVESVFHSCVYIASPAKSTEKYESVLSLSNKISDSSLYRVKTEQKYFDVNLIGGLGYNTLSHYTSLTNESFMYTMKKLGYSSYWMEVSSNGGTELTDAILGNRYSIINSKEKSNTDQIIYENGEYAVRENDITLPVGFVLNTERIEDLEHLQGATRLEIQQTLFQSVFHTDQKLVTQYEPSSLYNVSISKDDDYHITFPDNSMNGVITYEIPVTGTQTLYFDCFDRLSNSLVEHINSSFNIMANDALVQDDYPNQSNNGLVNLGTFTDQTVKIQVEVLKEVTARSFGVAGFNTDLLKDAVRHTTVANLKQEGSQLTGTAEGATGHDYLLLPLTYDKGYTATVNNKQTEVYRVFDSMIAVKLEKGNNSVSVSYCPPGLRTGAILSVGGILLLILALIFFQKGLYHKIKFLETPAMIVFVLLALGIFIAVYIFPVMVYLKG
jgi:uncharacterized membrane protein YfhO